MPDVEQTNNLDLPVGFSVPHWQPATNLGRNALMGRYCRLEPLDTKRHGSDLYHANQQDSDQRIWTYLPYGPFDSEQEYLRWMDQVCDRNDPFFYAIVDHKSEQAKGVASYLRIDPGIGSIEVGHINFSPALQNTVSATEAMFLMMQNAFALGYRRYEWKCDRLNAKSCHAATRLGFTFEGVFRQATMYKHRNRDTAWYSVIDGEWPKLRQAFNKWLSSENFDPAGQQKLALSNLTREALGNEI